MRSVQHIAILHHRAHSSHWKRDTSYYFWLLFLLLYTTSCTVDDPNRPLPFTNMYTTESIDNLICLIFDFRRDRLNEILIQCIHFVISLAKSDEQRRRWFYASSVIRFFFLSFLRSIRVKVSRFSRTKYRITLGHVISWKLAFQKLHDTSWNR